MKKVRVTIARSTDEASEKNINLADRKAMETAFAHTFRGLLEIRDRVLAFEGTMKQFDESVALAFNMKQKSTKMEKEKIQARLQKHMDMIKKRKDRIKFLTKKKKSVANPDTVRRMSQIATMHEGKIKKHLEAVKYYKMLASLKPKNKENPANRGVTK